MQLASIEVIPYALPFKEPYVTARGTLTQREMVLLRLTTDEGFVALGEAVPLSLRGGASIEQVVRELREVDESRALHDLIARGELEYGGATMIDPRLQLSCPSLAAVLGAIFDLCAKLEADADDDAGRTDEDPDRGVRCNATLVAGEPEAVAAQALHWAEEGFSTFKLKLGRGDDVGQVRAVREALGPGVTIRVDANAAWSLDTATATLLGLESFDLELAEQPVATMREAAELARRTSIPLAGDESIVTKADAVEAVRLNAFQVAGVKLSKVGGVFPALEIAEAMPAYVSSALDGPVGIAAGAMLAHSFNLEATMREEPPLAHGLATQRLFASTIAAVECELRNGMLHLPPGPGLGIEIDEDALHAHRL
jgi:o-succinylbenzoate synthase